VRFDRSARVGTSLISRVFVVDDERVIASTPTAILTVNGYDARCFVNPIEALEAARTAGPDPPHFGWLDALHRHLNAGSSCLPAPTQYALRGPNDAADFSQVVEQYSTTSKYLTLNCSFQGLAPTSPGLKQNGSSGQSIYHDVPSQRAETR
jgi:CheY-like chemotaxis protein